MRVCLLCILLICPGPVLACLRPICAVAPDQVSLAQLEDFESLAGGFGPGRLYRQVIDAGTVAFGEHLEGQARGADGPYDRITGAATAPLRLGDVPRGALLSITRIGQSSVLNGLGPEGYPRRAAEGEGAIAILFDTDQAALSLDIVGGEGGGARVQFLARDGAVLDQHDLVSLGEETRAFHTAGMVPLIAALVLTNNDPEGIAIDNLRYGLVMQMGAIGLGAGAQEAYGPVHVVEFSEPPAGDRARDTAR
jgi:hypothetical protein